MRHVGDPISLDLPQCLVVRRNSSERQAKVAKQAKQAKPAKPAKVAKQAKLISPVVRNRTSIPESPHTHTESYEFIS